MQRKKCIEVTVTVAALIIILTVLAGCSLFSKKTSGPDPGTLPGQEGSAPQKLNLAEYYVKITNDDAYLVREVHEVPYTADAPRAALEELINVAPATPGAQRVLPAGTKINGISIKDGLATVDFSREVLQANVGAAGEGLGITSIVNTLSEFPDIKKVSFLVEGKLDQQAKDWWGHIGLYSQPFKRDLSRVYEPSIWVTAPTPGQKIGSPLEVQGSARVFEAAVNLRLIDNTGEILAEGTATATSGAPSREDFVFSLPFTGSVSGSGNLEVFWISPEDGKEMDKVVVPVTW